MDVLKEVWKDVKGYEGKYQVSNTGKVLSLNYHREGYPNLLTLKTNSDGYKYVGLCKNNKVKTHRIHRLVAEHFLPLNLNPSLQINHKDEDKSNNNVNNLEWVTPKQNTNYGTCVKRRSQTVKLTGSRRNNNGKKIICVDTGEVYGSISEASKFTGIKRTTIRSSCKSGRKTRASKYLWKLLEVVCREY